MKGVPREVSAPFVFLVPSSDTHSRLIFTAPLILFFKIVNGCVSKINWSWILNISPKVESFHPLYIDSTGRPQQHFVFRHCLREVSQSCFAARFYPQHIPTGRRKNITAVLFYHHSHMTIHAANMLFRSAETQQNAGPAHRCGEAFARNIVERAQHAHQPCRHLNTAFACKSAPITTRAPVWKIPHCRI